MSDLQSLKDFLVLARLRSFSKAAEHCHVTTSGLSRRIQGLETWLGAPVFDRHKQQLELTDAGRQLQQTADEVVTAMDAVRASVRRQTEAQQDQIRLAAPHIMSGVFFPQWLSRLHTQFGQARFTVSSAVLPDCLRSLDRGDVDFVVCFDDPGGGIRRRSSHGAGWPPIESLKLGIDKLVPVSVPDLRGEAVHRLGGSGTVSFLGYDETCSLGWALEKALESLPGLPVLRRDHGNSLADGIRSMALIGMGVAWLPETMVREDLAARRLVRAAGDEHAVVLNVCVLRKAMRLGGRAEALWERLQENSSVDRLPA
jgi:DNA-binding transcriptional LysR family regulator